MNVKCLPGMLGFVWKKSQFPLFIWSKFPHDTASALLTVRSQPSHKPKFPEYERVMLSYAETRTLNVKLLSSAQRGNS